MRSFVPSGTRFILPLFGILVFVSLYLIAAACYPGGSAVDTSHLGFDWFNNYWCDLIAENARNGIRNPGRKVALSAMVILFSSLALFWYSLPKFFHEAKHTRIFVGYAGILSMGILVFIFTEFHDILIFAGGILSSIPFLAALRELFLHHWRKLFLLGVACFALIALNFFIYLTGWAILLLPFLQKIALVFFLSWIFLTNCTCLLIRRNRKGLHKRINNPSSGAGLRVPCHFRGREMF